MESNIYNWSIPQKCQTFATMIQNAQNTRELQTRISDIMKHVFGDAFFPTGWNLKFMTKATQFYEFNAVYNFLSIKGPFFSGIFKLSSESNVTFEFPLAHFPQSTRHCFEDGNCSAFYKPKLHVPLGASVPLSLLLSKYHLCSRKFSNWKMKISKLDLGFLFEYKFESILGYYFSLILGKVVHSITDYNLAL